MLVKAPETFVELIGVETIPFDPQHDFFITHPKVYERFDRHRRNVSSPMTCASFAFSGRLLEGIDDTRWDIAKAILSDETDFYNEFQRCPTLQLGYRRRPKFSAWYALDGPPKVTRLGQLVHWMEHTGFNPGLGYANRDKIKVPRKPFAHSVQDTDPDNCPNTFHLLYSCWFGPHEKEWGKKLEMIGKVAIRIIEGDPMAYMLDRDFWRILMQSPRIPINPDHPTWEHFLKAHKPQVQTADLVGVR